MRIGMPSAGRSTNVLKDKTGRNYPVTTKNWVGQPVLRSQMQTEKRKSFGKWSQGQERGILSSGGERQDFGKKQNSTGAVRRAPQSGDFSPGVFLGPRPCGVSGLRWLAQTSSNVCGRSGSRRAFGPTWTSGIVCVYAQHLWSGMCRSFSSRLRSRRRCRIARQVVPSTRLTFAPPFFSADVLKKCAQIAIALNCGRSKRWREWLWNFWFRKHVEIWLFKKSNVGQRGWSVVWGRKRFFKWFSREQCVQRCASRHRVVWAWWQGLSLLLKEWELARVALSCHIALDMLCQEMREAWWLV